MLPATGGVYEVTVNGELVFSKKELGRHAEPGEIKAAIVSRLEAIRNGAN
jgi:selenoprotein W-related protein